MVNGLIGIDKPYLAGDKDEYAPSDEPCPIPTPVRSNMIVKRGLVHWKRCIARLAIGFILMGNGGNNVAARVVDCNVAVRSGQINMAQL